MKKRYFQLGLGILLLLMACSSLKDQTKNILNQAETSDKQNAEDLPAKLRQEQQSIPADSSNSVSNNPLQSPKTQSAENIDTTLPQFPKEFLAIQDMEKTLRDLEYTLTDHDTPLTKNERKSLKQQKKEVEKKLSETKKAFKKKQQDKKKEMERRQKIEDGDTLSFWEKQFPKKTDRHITFPRIYKEKPRSILISHPWNRSDCTFAEDLFYASLQKPLALRGYYIIPPLLMNEFFTDTLLHTHHGKNQDLKHCKTDFGADAVLFVTIYRVEHEWWSSATKMNAEYLLRSTITNDTLFFRKIDYIYDTPLPPRRYKKDKNGPEISEEEQNLLNVCIAMQTAAFNDFPFGPYHPKHTKDSTSFSHRPFMRYNINTRPE